jgi:hypothetical protein
MPRSFLARGQAFSPMGIIDYLLFEDEFVKVLCSYLSPDDGLWPVINP